MGNTAGVAVPYSETGYYTVSKVRIRNNRIRRQRIFRRQLLIVGLAVSLLIFLMIFIGASFMSDAQSDEFVPQYKYYRTVTVHADDTVNSIAAQYYSEDNYSSLKEYITEICAINSISDPRSLRAGEALIVPYYSSEFK